MVSLLTCQILSFLFVEAPQCLLAKELCYPAGQHRSSLGANGPGLGHVEVYLVDSRLFVRHEKEAQMQDIGLGQKLS